MAVNLISPYNRSGTTFVKTAEKGEMSYLNRRDKIRLSSLFLFFWTLNRWDDACCVYSVSSRITLPEKLRSQVLPALWAFLC